MKNVFNYLASWGRQGKWCFNRHVLLCVSVGFGGWGNGSRWEQVKSEVKKANIYFRLVKRRRKKKEKRTKIPNPRDWIGCTGARAAVRKQDFKASQSNRRKCRGKQNGGTWWLADRLASMMTNSERHNGDGLSFVAANLIHASFFFSFCRSADLQIKNRTRRKKKGKGGKRSTLAK